MILHEFFRKKCVAAYNSPFVSLSQSLLYANMVWNTYMETEIVTELLLTSERSEEVPFFIAAFSPAKGVTAIGGFCHESCLIFWSRLTKFWSNVCFWKPERLASSFF